MQTRRLPLPRCAAWMLAAAIILGSATALSQSYPAKPVHFVVPSAPGTVADAVGRLLAPDMSRPLGQTIIIENKPGAGGNIGAQQASRAKADGYTLFMGTVGTHAINQALYKKLPYDPAKDFAPLSRVANVPNLLVAHPSRPYKTVQEMIAYAKKHPGEVTYGSPGSGASPHVSGALFQSMTGAELTHVPYKGSAPAISDLLGNQIAVMFDNMPSAIQHVRSGKLRPIAVTTAKRSPELPDVPTIAEAGVPGYEATSWFGLWAVAGTPAPILTKLQTALTKVLKDPAVAKKIADQGGEVVIETPAQFDAFIKSEAAKWGKVVKESGAEV